MSKRKQLINLFLLLMVALFSGQGCVSLSGSKTTTTGPAGIFVSSDKGDSWKQSNILPKADGLKSISGASIYRIVEDPQDPKTMYLATRDKGMFYSYDDGISWHQPEGPLSSGFVYSVAINPKIKCTVYATNGTQIFKSDDCNRSWQETYRESRSEVKVVSLAYNPFYPNDILMAESNGDVLRSTDDGKSWMIVNRFGVKLSEIIADPLQENVFYIASRNSGLYKSIDGGNSWTSLKSSFSSFSGALEFRRLVMHPNKADVIYWISTYGILISDNGGGSWTSLPLITAPGSANIYSFDINGANDNEIFYVATIGERSTFYRSAGGGKNWVTKKLPSGQIPTAMRVRPGKENMLFLGFTIPPSQ